MGKIANPRSKPKKFGMERVQQKIINRKLKNPDINKRQQAKLLNCEFTEKFAGGSDPRKYSRGRGYQEYNHMIQFLSQSSEFKTKSILHMLAEYSKTHHKKVIKILDEGAGRGAFLTGLKDMWGTFKKIEGVNSKLETTAIVLDVEDLKRTKIDHAYGGDVNGYVPKEKFDFIFSVFGGFTYTTPKLQREVLLKHLYSLEKGGYGFFGFSSEHKKEYTDIFVRKLEKIGFKAEYKDYNNNQHKETRAKFIEENLPRQYLIVKRIK